mgnify:CR=1 FL=1
MGARIDPDGALLLAAAIARQWLREHPDELPVIAAWLGIDVDVLRRLLTMPPPTRSRRHRRRPRAV